MAPPSAPPGLGAAPAENSEEQLQKEITSTIEAQVSRLLLQARNETESKVKVELKQIIDAMVAMDRHLDQLIVQMDALEPKEQPEAPVSAEHVGQLLSRLEQQWGQEIKTLKQELHQTILAHNHNADLIKHHKDTLDSLQERSHKLSGSNVKTQEVQQQLLKLDARLKQQQKQRKLEPLFERLTVLEAQLARMAPQSAAWRFPGMGGMPPAMSPMLPPGMLGPPGMPGMGMGAPGLGAAGAPVAKRAAVPAPKADDKALAKATFRPTDAEVAAQLSKAVPTPKPDALAASPDAAPKAEAAPGADAAA